jgi:hypothetical protein
VPFSDFAEIPVTVCRLRAANSQTLLPFMETTWQHSQITLPKFALLPEPFRALADSRSNFLLATFLLRVIPLMYLSP